MSSTAPEASAPPEIMAQKRPKGLLVGIVLAVTTFWLFSGAVGTMAPSIVSSLNSEDPTVITDEMMNFAVSLTALFSGLFIVVSGGFADRFGRVRVMAIGIGLNILGSLLILFAAGTAAVPLILIGRTIQGFSAAAIMPASLGVVKSMWHGAERQRAVSMWSIGSWGGTGFAAIVGGVADNSIGWRGIFILSLVASVLALLLMRGTPETKAPEHEHEAFDVVGLIPFVIGMLAFMIVVLFGQDLGWLTPTVLVLAVIAVIGLAIFSAVELRVREPFFNIRLLKNRAFAGATISNFLLNGTVGVLLVSQQLLQVGAVKANGEAFTALDAGVISLGYGICVVLFVRIGEKMLQAMGPRTPMIVGPVVVAVACLMLMLTNTLVEQYVIIAIIAYALFGAGLGIYATPSTDTALATLPPAQGSAGAGIYKMASTLGNALGTAVSLAVFTALSSAAAPVLGNLVPMAGRTDNVVVREAGMMALGVNLVFILAAIIITLMTLPRGTGDFEYHGTEEEPDDPAPAAQERRPSREAARPLGAREAWAD